MYKIPLLTHATLKRYYTIINDIPNLSKEDEIKYMLSKNMHMLYIQGLKWVYFFANKFKNRYDILDLIQQGNLGLWKSIEKFDVTKDVKLITYASLWIRSYIFEYVIKNLSVASGSSRLLKQKFFKKEVDDMLYEYNNLIKNQANIYLAELTDVLLVSKDNIEEEFIDDDLLHVRMKKMHEAIENLNDKRKMVLTEYYLNKRTMVDIGKELGVSKQRIKQIIETSVNCVRNQLDEELK